MLTLSDFHATVRAAIGRGNVLDATIVSQTRKAVRWLERNADPGYLYMKKWADVTLTASGTNPHILDFPNDRVKCFLMFRLTVDGEYKYLNLINARDVAALTTERPQGYWLDAGKRIVLDAKPDIDYSGEMIWVEYTSWGTEDGYTHWLLDNAEDVLFHRTMMNMSPWLRDDRMYAVFEKELSSGLNTLEGSKINLDNENASEVMRYVQH